jgi:hypothetical protein
MTSTNTGQEFTKTSSVKFELQPNEHLEPQQPLQPMEQLQPMKQLQPHLTPHPTLHQTLNHQKCLSGSFVHQDVSLTKSAAQLMPDKFYERALQEFCVKERTAVFSLSLFRRSLDQQQLSEAALDQAVKKMIASEELRSIAPRQLQLFRDCSQRAQSNDGVGEAGVFTRGYNWVVNGVWSFFYTQTNKEDSDYFDNKDTDIYVNEHVLLTMADKLRERLLATAGDRPANSILWSELYGLTQDICCNEISFKLCVRDLCSRNDCTVKKEKTGELSIRLTKSRKRHAVVNDTTIQIAKMHRVMTKLQEESRDKVHKTAGLRVAAKRSLVNNDKLSALRYLKKSKLLDASVKENDKTLDRLKNLTLALEAASNKLDWLKMHNEFDQMDDEELNNDLEHLLDLDSEEDLMFPQEPTDEPYTPNGCVPKRRASYDMEPNI